jgi:hypothetical protein
VGSLRGNKFESEVVLVQLTQSSFLGFKLPLLDGILPKILQDFVLDNGILGFMGNGLVEIREVDGLVDLVAMVEYLEMF